MSDAEMVNARLATLEARQLVLVKLFAGLLIRTPSSFEQGTFHAHAIEEIRLHFPELDTES